MRVIQGICEGYRSNDQILATLLWDQVSQKNNEEQEEKK